MIRPILGFALALAWSSATAHAANPAPRPNILFNLADDLGETRNLADREPDRVQALANELTAYLRKYHAPMPVVKATSRLVSYPAEALATVGH